MQFIRLQNLLSATALLGVFWLAVIFGVCFFGVHIARLVRFGWLYQKKEELQKATEEKEGKEEKKEKAPEPKPSAEPVYYIVERKRKTRQSYGEPKEIRFK